MCELCSALLFLRCKKKKTRKVIVCNMTHFVSYLIFCFYHQKASTNLDSELDIDLCHFIFSDVTALNEYSTEGLSLQVEHILVSGSLAITSTNLAFLFCFFLILCDIVTLSVRTQICRWNINIVLKDTLPFLAPHFGLKVERKKKERIAYYLFYRLTKLLFD